MAQMRQGPTLGAPKRRDAPSVPALFIAFAAAFVAGAAGLGAALLFDAVFGTGIAIKGEGKTGMSVPGSVAAIVGFVAAYIHIERRRSRRRGGRRDDR